MLFCMMQTRLNKFLAENGYCSRREADRLIEAGRVFVNGQQATLGVKVSQKDEIRVEGRDKRKPPEKIYLLLNKPRGIIVTTDRRKKNNVRDFVGCPERVFPVGRLDVQSEGLLILTNDDTLSHRLMHPRYEHEKEYVVEVDRSLDLQDIGALQHGILLEDGMTLPAKVRKLDTHRFAIILREGRNRQIRRMCSALGAEVVSLKRTRLLTLKMPLSFPSGAWRHLSASEVRELKNALGMNKNLTP